MPCQVRTDGDKWRLVSHSVVADVKDETIVLSDQSLTFKGTSENKQYEVNLEFLNALDAEGSTYKVLPRSIQMLLKKKEASDEFWPRLLKDKTLEKNQVKIDWDRYVDEDEEEEGFDTSNLEGGMGMGGMPGMGGGGGGGMDMEALMKQMGGMGGMEGLGGDGPDFASEDADGDDADDDDDEDLPALEEVN